MARVLIAGCGYVGCALGLRLAAAGHTVWGLRRRPSFSSESIRPVVADLSRPETLDALPRELDVVFYTAAADRRDEAAYEQAYVRGLEHLLGALDRQRQSPSRIFFTSSTAVYAQSDGEWVDETSPTDPVHFTGQRVLEGERVLAGHPARTVVVRLGGLYGPGRTRLVDRVRRGEVGVAPGSPQYTNRIHRDDAAGLLLHLMALEQIDPLYIGVDAEPASMQAVVRWLAGELGLPQPPGGAGDVSTAGRGGKRCSSSRLVGSGYRFAYPSFREGYRSLISPE